jgi:hypothetical protein
VGSAVSGRVVDRETGRSVAGATVHAYDSHPILFAHGSASELGLRTTRTDADGRFVLPGTFAVIFDIGLTDFSPTVAVDHPRYSPGEQSLPIGSWNRAELALWPDPYFPESVPFRLKQYDPLWDCVGDPDCWSGPPEEPGRVEPLESGGRSPNLRSRLGVN